MPDPINRWPFNSLLNSRGNPTAWALVHSRVVTPRQQELLANLRREGYRFIGMASDGTFPLAEAGDPVSAADTIDYAVMCEAWCHCFRNPDQYLPPGQPRALISDSDFVDFRKLGPAQSGSLASVEFDFIYVGAESEWKRRSKNLELAERCIPLICASLGCRALVVGGVQDNGLSSLPGVTEKRWLPWFDFLRHLARAQFLFLPNRDDASPRVMAEALCLDTPVVVHRQILGGWKYVNPWTGVFFDDERDVVWAVEQCLSRNRNPRRWFCANYGPYRSGRRLLALLRRVDPSITERSHLTLGSQSAP